MEFNAFVVSIFAGFLMAIPIGPMGMMCVSKTLTESRFSGLVVGLAAAIVDLFYSGIAAFGLTFISGIILEQKIWIRLFGGILLLLFGLKIFKAKPINPKVRISSNKNLGLFISVILMGLTNPLTIFVFVAIFSEYGFGKSKSSFQAISLMFGVFLGTFLWFTILYLGAAFFRYKLNLNGLVWTNRIAGIFIIGSGIFAVISLL